MPLLITLIANIALYISLEAVGASINTLDMKIQLRFNQQTTTVTLKDNPSSRGFIAQLPLTLVMYELNGNEKYAVLPKQLPVQAISPGKLRNGDLMLYGDDTLVLFYKSFPTNYSYTQLGHIDDISSLKIPTQGNIRIEFSIYNASDDMQLPHPNQTRNTTDAGASIGQETAGKNGPRPR